MKRAALAALLLVLVPLQARALQTDELLGLVAMPLAVAAASEVTGVPVSDLSHLVTTLNRAEVQPVQFVQVVRYAPAAIVVQDPQPTFVEYVDREVDQGVTGSQLVTVIEDRYQTYDLNPQFVPLQEPATAYVVRDDYIPPVVVTRVAQVAPAYVVGDTNDLLSLVAMPLAVAAVSNVTGVPFNDLSSFVSALNAAQVPPLQVVQVLRYTPVALVDEYGRPQFIQYVQTEVARGVTGPQLVDVIGQRLRTYDVTPTFNDLRPAEVVTVVDDDDAFFPPVIDTRVAEVRKHPHGGPPGQLKKELGLQTGAEVVHGTRPGYVPTRVTRSERVVKDRPERVITKHEHAKPQHVKREHPKGHVSKHVERPKMQRQIVQRPQVERRMVVQPRVERHVVQQPKGRGMGGNAGGGHGHGGGGGGAHGQGKGKGKGKG